MTGRRGLVIRFRDALRGAAMGLSGVMLVVLAAVAVVWPLWFLATKHTGLYTTLSLSAIALALIYTMVAKGMRRKAESSNANVNP